VPETAAGKSVRCGGCGNSVAIPNPTRAPAKLCTACGIDVAGQKRTKDTAGRYYCQPCWQAKIDAGRAAALAGLREAKGVGMVAARGVVAGHARPLAKPQAAKPVLIPQPARVGESSADDDLETLEECPQCFTNFPAGELVLGDDDQMVCPSCARQELALADDLPEGPVGIVEQPYYVPPSPPRQVIAYRSPPPARAKPKRNYGSSHDGALLVNGVIFGVGIAITVGTYMAAANGGTYFVAWGAILFGGIRFFKALAGKLSGN
jgi:hypothetical protein